MLQLRKSQQHWNSDQFAAVFKAEVAALDKNDLPLQKNLRYSSYVSDEPVSAVILKRSETDDCYKVEASIFYSGIIAGCSCADDPTPVDLNNESCELIFYIDRHNGQTRVEEPHNEL